LTELSEPSSDESGKEKEKTDDINQRLMQNVHQLDEEDSDWDEQAGMDR
jgi:hypothetical protein